MVVSIRELGNITLSTTTICSTTNNIALTQDINMVVDPLDNLFDIGNNFDEVRGCSLVLSTHRPRSSSISLRKCDKEYHIHVKRNSNRMEEDEPVISVGSIQVEYAFQEVRNGQVSKVADNTNNMCY